MQLVTLSAKSVEALKELAAEYEGHLAAKPELSLAGISYTGQIGRAHFGQRLAVVAGDKAELAQKLAAYRQGELGVGVAAGEAASPPPVAFLFTGQGAQYVGMGQELYQSSPAFRQTVDECAALLQPHLPAPLLEVLFATDAADSRLHQTVFTQPALFVLEYALARLWQSWGIQPALLLGHSIGEVVAACLAGVLSLPDALQLIAARGRLMQALPPQGAMAVLFATEESVSQMLAATAGQVAIAAVNGPENVVISGQQAAVAAAAAQVAAAGKRTELLQVSHAFHSPLMEPMLAEFGQLASRLTFHPPRLRLVANVSGTLAGSEIASAAYWQQHVRQPVRFAAGMQTLAAHGCRIFVEVGPKPTLLGMARHCLPQTTAAWLPSLHPKQPAWQTLLHSLGSLYVQGVAVDWAAFHAGYEQAKVSLPTYPFQRQRYWLGTTLPTTRPAPAVSAGDVHPLLGRRLSLPRSAEVRFETAFSPDAPAYLGDHRLFETVVVPAASHIAMLLAAVPAAWHTDACHIADFIFPQTLVLPDERPRAVQLLLQPESDGVFACHILSQGDTADWTVHASGRVAPRPTPANGAASVNLADIQGRCPQPLAGDAFYAAYAATGYGWGPAFRWLAELWQGQGEALCRMAPAAAATLGDLSAYLLHPGLIDSAFHVLASCEPTLAQELQAGDYIYIPFSINHIYLHARDRKSVV